MKYGFVYVWFDRKHKRYYVGCHWGYVDDGYICSSPWMKQAYNKRPQDFKRRIVSLVYTTRQDMFDEEAHWQSMISDDELRTRYYNIRRHGDRHWSANPNKHLSTKQKLSSTMKEKHQDPEYRKIYEAGREQLKGNKQSPELVAKRAVAIKEAKAIQFPIENRKTRSEKGSEEHLKKLSDASNKRWSQPGAKEKQSILTREANLGKQHRLGHKNTPEHIAKIVAANKGRKRTPEQIEKMRQAKLGTKATPEQRAARSLKTKQMWADRRAGLIPMPSYGKDK